MYKDVLQNIDNIAIWPMISFVIFFLFFIILLWWTFTADKNFIKRMSDMPLEQMPENNDQVQEVKFNSKDMNVKNKTQIKMSKSPLSFGERPGVRLNRIIASLLFLPVATFAQAAESKSFMDDPFSSPLLPLYVVTALVFITIILVMTVAIKMVGILNLMIRQDAEKKAAKEGKPYMVQATWWDKFWEDINASVPLAEEKSIELDHNYDGIKELDNHLPPWWKGLLYGSIVWAVVYFFMYHVSLSLPLSIEEYDNQVAEADAAKRAHLASQPAAVIDENALVYSAEADILAAGEKVFVSNNCQSCHRPDGGGNAIGPNLTDDYWIHGGTIKEIFTTIKTGVPEKGMPAWGKVMSPQSVRDVTFYVMSLGGTNPPNPKAPQGNKYIPEEPAAKADSTKTTASVQ